MAETRDGGATTANKRRVIVCAGTGCVSNGALKVHAAFTQALEEGAIPFDLRFKPESEQLHLSKSGCQGFCQMGPLVTILPEGVLYTRVKPEDVDEIVATTVGRGEILSRLLYVDPATKSACKGFAEIPFYKRQTRYVLKDCGWIDPEDLGEYLSMGGYEAAKRAWLGMTDEAIVGVVTASGLRGRGGGGYPTGRKWDAARLQPAGKKYVICNGDEGDPGAFMDRSVMEGDPHRVLEGILIAARAIGADEAYVYVRAEYPLAVRRMRQAVVDACLAGILGDSVFGTGLPMHCIVMEGAGAFVCGEETALMASIEGLRGMPVPKPPFPAQAGLWGKPTLINNVETLAQVPRILSDGPERYRAMGTAKSPGTKTFALTGHVVNTGLIEVPFGTTLREVVMEIGGGITDARGKAKGELFKAVQIGGPSGGCLTPEMLDMPLDFDSLKSVGAMVGSGGLVAMNQETCMVGIARFFMQFTQRESCGKCVLCREGTRQLLGMLDDVMEGRAEPGDLARMEELAKAVQKGSLCGLGKTAPNPVLSTLKYFRGEYEQHVHDKHCATGACKALAKPHIVEELCKGCTLCVKACPVGAITGERKKAHVLDLKVCIKCGACAAVCKLHAIHGVLP
jgi:NADH-quinone oxidoreductase subunit F